MYRLPAGVEPEADLFIEKLDRAPTDDRFYYSFILSLI